jgi:hypothetical protein
VRWQLAQRVVATVCHDLDANECIEPVGEGVSEAVGDDYEVAAVVCGDPEPSVSPGGNRPGPEQAGVGVDGRDLLLVSVYYCWVM